MVFVFSAYLCAVIKRIIVMQKESPILEQQRPDRQYYSRQNRIKRELDHAVTLLKAAFASWIILTIVCAFIGCSTKQTVIDQTESHHSKADSLSASLQVAVSQQQTRIDSLFHLVLQQELSHQTANEQQTEQIQETVTSWIDSLGRKVTQEARTINRKTDRQEELRQQRIIQEQEQRIQTCQERIDSLYALLLEKTAKEESDTTAYHKETILQRQTPSLLERFHDWLTGIINVIVLAAIVGFIVRWKKKKWNL